MRATERRDVFSALRVRTVLAVNLAVVGLLAWGFHGEYARHRALEGEIAHLNARAEDLREGNLERERIHERSLSESGLEREARLKLNLRKPGEEVLIIQGVPATSAARASVVVGSANVGDAAAADTSAPSNTERWRRFLFGR